MTLRKFEIVRIEESHGGAGPNRAWKVHYRAIVKKQWVSDMLWVVARNAIEARHQAEQRFGGKR